MGKYRLGDIIRMTRKSLSITQQQLCDKICSIETLSRIENGSQSPGKDLYERLSERMGRIGERAYSMLSVSDFRIFEKMKLFEDYIKQYNYNQADIVLSEIKETLGNTTLDRQFLIKAECLVNYRLKRIGIQEYLDGFQDAILLTIPRYGEIPLSNWPLSFNEALLLNNISIAYAEKEDYSKSIEIIEEVYIAIKQSYMDEQQRVILQVLMATNLSKWYGMAKNHEKAIEIAKEGILLCKKFKLGNVLPILIYAIAWNKEQLIELGVLSPEDKKECLMYIKQAYYIASAMQNTFMEQFLRKHIVEKDYVSTGIF